MRERTGRWERVSLGFGWASDPHDKNANTTCCSVWSRDTVVCSRFFGELLHGIGRGILRREAVMGFGLSIFCGHMGEYCGFFGDLVGHMTEIARSSEGFGLSFV